MWQALFTALALLLVLEGLMPFLNPGLWRRLARLAADMDEGALRVGGLLLMLAGLGLLFLVR